MKKTETVKTYATNLMEQITGLDMITDAQVEAIKGTRIRSLTRDTIVCELANINDAFLVYGRTKNILLCTENMVVLVGEVEVVNGLALALNDGVVAYLKGDSKLESDFVNAMWSCANTGDIIAKCIKYLKGDGEEVGVPAPDSIPDPCLTKKAEPAAAPKKDAPPVPVFVKKPEAAPAECEPKKAKTLEELYVETKPKAVIVEKTAVPVRRRRVEHHVESEVVVKTEPSSEPAPEVVEDAAEDAATTLKRMAAEEGIDASCIDW